MGGTGVPWINWSGKQGDYNVMVIDMLGLSLEDLFKRCNRHFSLKTVLLLADQLVSLFPGHVVYATCLLLTITTLMFSDLTNRVHTFEFFCPSWHQARQFRYGYWQIFPPCERHWLWSRKKISRFTNIEPYTIQARWISWRRHVTLRIYQYPSWCGWVTVHFVIPRVFFLIFLNHFLPNSFYKNHHVATISNHWPTC